MTTLSVFQFAHRTGARYNISNPTSSSNNVDLTLDMVICLFNHLASHPLMHIYSIQYIFLLFIGKMGTINKCQALLNMLANLNLTISSVIGNIPILHMIFVR